MPPAPDDPLLAWAHRWFATLGVRPEADAYLAAAAAWRQVWRPERVKVLLVRESHVAESGIDADVRVRPPDHLGRELPVGYARLIHCLGFGESSLCTPRPAANKGSYEDWKLLAQLGLGLWARMPKGVRPEQRLRWKLDVLEGLARRGIWLQHASPIGLSLPDGKELADPAGRAYAQLLREGYQQFVWPAVEGDRPEQVWVIGRGVGKALAGLPGIDPGRVISQPQDRNQTRYRTGFQKLQTAIEQLTASPRA